MKLNKLFFYLLFLPLQVFAESNLVSYQAPASFSPFHAVANELVICHCSNNGNWGFYFDNEFSRACFQKNSPNA